MSKFYMLKGSALIFVVVLLTFNFGSLVVCNYVFIFYFWDSA